MNSNFLTAALALTLCGLPISPLLAESLKVGAILPLSGEPAAVGENCRKGVELARREHERQGLALQVFYEDTPEASARNTLTAFNKLRSTNGVENFLGFLWSEELGAVGPIADKEGIALVGFSLPAQKPKNSIFIWPAEAREAQALAEEVVKKYSRVAILSETTTWAVNFSQAFMLEFKKRGGTVFELVEISADNRDVTSSVAKLKKYDLQAVVVPPYTLFPQYAKTLRKLGMKLPIYSAELDQSAVDRAEGAAEGVVVIGPADPSADFIARFEREFNGTQPDIPAGNCYDGLNILAAAFKEKKSGRGEKILEYLREMKTYQGALGAYQFEDGETIIDLGFKVVRGGKLSPRD